MYLKLAFGNAKRSAFDYLLYIFTMIILVSIMCVSNCIAVSGQMQLGFGTASLPLLIVLIMVVLIAYINTFMMKQRAKEFATYSLLGMDKNKLSLYSYSKCSWLIKKHIPKQHRQGQPPLHYSVNMQGNL